MKFAGILIIAALSITGSAAAHPHHCNSSNDKNCPVPPVPPAPPAPPAPPMAPVPPLPPPPMLIPDAPQAAHAACAGKKAGSSMSFVLGKGKTMAGRCVNEGGKMVFEVEAYHSEE
jgi:hypothetical protein